MRTTIESTQATTMRPESENAYLCDYEFAETNHIMINDVEVFKTQEYAFYKEHIQFIKKVLSKLEIENNEQYRFEAVSLALDDEYCDFTI